MRHGALLLFAAFAALINLGAAQQGSNYHLDDLVWLSGDWSTTSPGTIIEEHWTRPAGNTMIGMGRTIIQGKTVFFEYLRIESRPEGIVYVAHPKARPGTDFKLVTLTDTEAVFENPEHEFPRRIIYRKNRNGTITARVEGKADGKDKEEEFPYHRMTN